MPAVRSRRWQAHGLNSGSLPPAWAKQPDSLASPARGAPHATGRSRSRVAAVANLPNGSRVAVVPRGRQLQPVRPLAVVERLAERVSTAVIMGRVGPAALLRVELGGISPSHQAKFRPKNPPISRRPFRRL